MTLTSATVSGSDSSARVKASRSRMPSRVTRTRVTVKPSFAARSSTTAVTAGCSTAEMRMRVRPGAAERAARAAPRSAQLFDSVPPDVKTTSLGEQPSKLATLARAAVTAAAGCLPYACEDDGLPNTSLQTLSTYNRTMRLMSDANR